MTNRYDVRNEYGRRIGWIDVRNPYAEAAGFLFLLGIAIWLTLWLAKLALSLLWALVALTRKYPRIMIPVEVICALAYGAYLFPRVFITQSSLVTGGLRETVLYNPSGDPTLSVKVTNASYKDKYAAFYVTAQITGSREGRVTCDITSNRFSPYYTVRLPAKATTETTAYFSTYGCFQDSSANDIQEFIVTSCRMEIGDSPTIGYDFDQSKTSTVECLP